MTAAESSPHAPFGAGAGVPSSAPEPPAGPPAELSAGDGFGDGAGNPCELLPDLPSPAAPADWRAWIVPPEESRQEAGGAPALPPLAAHLPPGGGPARWPNFRVGNEAIPACPDPLRMYLENQARVREELKRRDLAAVLIYDPLNLRYVSGVRNMSIWTFHSPARYGFLPAEGPFVLFDFHGSAHLSDDAATVGEVRPARSWY